ncbi:MAG: hypothetical protein R6T83_09050 [Salinibacter sp.]
MSADAPAADAPDEDATQEGIVQELSHEEFDPYGTLAVTGMYFLLLLVLYALMYFVEFANRPSIIE